MTRRVFRYVPFTIVQDQTAEPEYEARCVSGEESECGARSGTYSAPGPVEEWQRQHTQETGHRRYRRDFGDYAVLCPSSEPVAPPELVARVRPAGREP
ncbi:hypothetical protein [Streptomyces sp. NPDC006012]|uniref:DUF7848 domain-containing protein n=1 Tax=Streptomyces sp. NPDC006012 TaxID=3364739 RepID=UPI0036900338